MVTVLHLNLASLPWNSRSALMIKTGETEKLRSKEELKQFWIAWRSHSVPLQSCPLFSTHLKSADNVSQTSLSHVREGGKQRAACWILAARASVNKGNKLQLRLPQGLKWSLHIKHRVSFGWRDAEELCWPLWGWWGRWVGMGVGMTIRRRSHPLLQFFTW